jgi:hypothetical protein
MLVYNYNSSYSGSRDRRLVVCPGKSTRPYLKNKLKAKRLKW